MASELVSNDVLEERRAICNGCEFKVDMSDNPLFNTFIPLDKLIPDPVKNVCSQCGCFTHFKTRKKHMECPVNKWQKAE